jgi:hypothetical protein
MRRLLVLVALTFVSGGCGAAENDPKLAEAIDQTEATGSSLIAVDATGSDGEIKCEGAARYERARLRLTCNSAAGSYAVVAIGNTTYMRGDLLGIVSAGDKWVKYTDDESIGTRFSPRSLLRMLRGASEEMRRLGEEDVRGVETVRYRLDVNCDRVNVFDCDGATTPVEVWIGDDGLVRRIWIEEESNAGAIEFYDFGADVAVDPPPAGDVEDLYASGGRQRCSETHGAPISVEQALAALRRSDFDASEPYCLASIAVLGATNAAGSPGLLSCFLAPRAPDGAPTTTRRRGVDGGDAQVELHNFTCAILADSPSREATIARLEAAFAELERTARP